MKKKKIIALLLAASMMVMPLPATAANDSPGVRIAGGEWKILVALQIAERAL